MFDVAGFAGQPYIDAVRQTAPVMYVPFQGSFASLRELVRGTSIASTAAAPLSFNGPFPGSRSMRFSDTTADKDSAIVTTNAAYHPGDVFSVGGWFNRLAQGEPTGPAILHMGTGDFVVWFDTTDKFTLRKAGTGNIFATTRTFATPYADGWTHGFFTKNGATTIAYLNGASAAGSTTNQTVVGSSSNPTFCMTAGGTGNDFAGALAHWGIWNRVLTPAEILTLFLAGKNAT